MTETINIHPDFANMPAMKSITHPCLLAAMNAGLQAASIPKWFSHRRITTKHQLTGSDGKHYPAWLISPENSTKPAPLLIYFHGSGFMVKHVPQHIENAVHYARGAGCNVLFVDYRLAPRYRFPTPFNDCYESLLWSLNNADALSIDTSRIAIGGDSAGGALATSVVQKAHGQQISVCGQLLVYPITDCRCATYSSTVFANVPPFKQFSMPELWHHYLGDYDPASPPEYASPMHGNKTGLPPAYLETEQYDPWRDEGAEYAKAMEKAGVTVELNQIEGTVHGFDAFVPNSQIVLRAMERRIAFLRRAFA